MKAFYWINVRIWFYVLVLLLLLTGGLSIIPLYPLYAWLFVPTNIVLTKAVEDTVFLYGNKTPAIYTECVDALLFASLPIAYQLPDTDEP